MAEGFQAVEFLEGAAVLAFRLGLVAQEELPGVGLAVQAVEAIGEGIVAVLLAGDLDVADEVLAHGGEGPALVVQTLVEAGGEEAGFESGGADEGLLGEGDALDGEEFLGGCDILLYFPNPLKTLIVAHPPRAFAAGALDISPWRAVAAEPIRNPAPPPESPKAPWPRPDVLEGSFPQSCAV